MKKILLLGSQHGNELLGEYMYDYITLHRPDLKPHIDFLIGNPRARRQNVRLVESDMNRSFNGQADTYEEQRAAEVLKYITKQEFDLVLDLHTTTCEQPPCIITASTSHQFINATSITHIVHMHHDTVKTSLIGVCPRAISIEVNENNVNAEIADALCKDIERFISEKPSRANKQIYRVDGLLEKTEISADDVLQLRNFHKSKFGFYPILVGENSYKKHTNYLGFKAYVVDQSRV